MQRLEISKWFPKPGITEHFATRTANQTQHIDYRADADADWIKQSSGLGYLPLSIVLPADIMLHEARAVIPYMVDLNVGGNDSHGWTGLGLFGINTAQQGDYGNSNVASNNQWGAIALEHMPETVKWFEAHWPREQFWKIRLLGLAPGGVVGMHNDDCNGLDNINIAIDHPAGCDFYLDQSGIVPFKNGTAFAIDVSRWHAVINRSDQIRLHMVIYQKDNKHFEDLVKISYHEYAKSLACC